MIEAVYENMDIKKTIFARLDGVAKPGAILASNTSYLNIDEIAATTKRPEDVLGMHFFSPANVMRLLEIVRGEKTSKPVLATVAALAPKIGKVGVTVGVCYGFVGNRMLAERQREAGKLILEGATPSQVDRVLTDFGMPMGPFAMSDLAGLDIGWSAETSKRGSIRDILCEEGRRGQKTGAGFYDYDEQRNAKPSAHVEEIIRAFAASKGVAQRTISDQEILERCIYPMINEGAKILEEGKAQRASDIDVVWIMGYGWPVYRGGPMFYADTVGPEDRARQAEGISGDVRRRLQACGPPGEARRRGRRVFEGVNSMARSALPSPRSREKMAKGRMRAARIRTLASARPECGEPHPSPLPASGERGSERSIPCVKPSSSPPRAPRSARPIAARSTTPRPRRSAATRSPRR